MQDSLCAFWEQADNMNERGQPAKYGATDAILN